MIGKCIWLQALNKQSQACPSQWECLAMWLYDKMHPHTSGDENRRSFALLGRNPGTSHPPYQSWAKPFSHPCITTTHCFCSASDWGLTSEGGEGVGVVAGEGCWQWKRIRRGKEATNSSKLFCYTVLLIKVVMTADCWVGLPCATNVWKKGFSYKWLGCWLAMLYFTIISLVWYFTDGRMQQWLHDTAWIFGLI